MKRGFKFVFINILLLFLSLVLSGCLLPHTTEVAPAIKGQIVDEKVDTDIDTGASLN